MQDNGAGEPQARDEARDNQNNEEQEEPQPNHEEEQEEQPPPPLYEKTQYDTHPNLDPMHPNNNSGVPLLSRATAEEIIRDPFTVIDHISFNQCYGTAGASFDECERVPWACREMWAEFYGENCNQAVIATEYDHLMSTNQVEYNLFMERHVKMFFLVPTLIFRKLNDLGTKIHHMVRRRLTDWRSNHLGKMIDNFEADLVNINSNRYVQPQSESSEQLKMVKKVTDLVQLGQMKKARQLLLSTGCSDPNEPHIVEQMKRKFPTRKEEIREPTDEQFAHPRAQLDVDQFRIAIKQLKPKMAPGLGCFRNEHLTALLYDEGSKVSQGAKSAFDKMHAFCDKILACNLPWYFYAAWGATSLSAINKLDPSELQGDQQMDCRPVAKGYPLNKALEKKAAIRQYTDAIINRTAPTQFGCALKGGGSQLIMSIQAHMEAHPEHVCITMDISNAYNEMQ